MVYQFRAWSWSEDRMSGARIYKAVTEDLLGVFVYEPAS
jgi:hypothetical protein